MMADNDIPELIPEHEPMQDDDDDDSNIDESEDGWEELPTDDGDQILCLFCPIIYKSLDIAFEHLKSVHKIELAKLKGNFQMDFYDYIKMINFIRMHKITDAEFLKLEKAAWNDEKYLLPVVGQDAWLMYDFDDLSEEDVAAGVDDAAEISIPRWKLKELEKTNTSLMRDLKSKNLMLEQATEDIEKMRASFKNLIEKMESTTERETVRSKYIAGDVACVGNLSLRDDEGYFNSYAHYGIHHDMLSDVVRTTSYRDAILKNAATFAGKDVMDLGCGTSILSMFSAKAGASKVVGVDQSDIIYQAMDIVKRNNFENITLVKGRLEDTELPIDKFDIIVSEWMGYFLLFEGMLDSVIYARNRHLKEGGMLLPNRCNISLVGYGDVDRYGEFITYWKDVYGFDMSCMKKEVLREATIEICKPEHVITSPNVIAEFDLMTVGFSCADFSYNFNLKVTSTGKLTSFVGYFDTFFDLPEKVEFSTSPEATPTHWKQIVFYLRKAIDVTEGDVITGKFICHRNVKDVRSLSITIETMGNVYKYNLN